MRVRDSYDSVGLTGRIFHSALVYKEIQQVEFPLDHLYDEYDDFDDDYKSSLCSVSPLLLAMYFDPGIYPYPHARLLDTWLVALIEMRLYPDGPGEPPWVYKLLNGDTYTFIGIGVDAVMSKEAFRSPGLLMARPIPGITPPDFAESKDFAPKNRVVQQLGVHEPPRHGKSVISTQSLPLTYLLRHPRGAALVATYNSTFARSNGAGVGSKLKEFGSKLPLATDNMPLCPPMDMSSSEISFRPGKDTGQILYRGVDESMTGGGFSLGLIDDPFKGPKEAGSPKVRQTTTEWYESVYDTRPTKIFGCPLPVSVVVFTRWHELDLAGYYIYERDGETVKPGWAALRLPAIAEDNDPLGRNKGEALCPQLITLEYLQRKRRENPGTFQCLYQGKPSTDTGTMFKKTMDSETTASGKDYYRWRLFGSHDVKNARYISGPAPGGRAEVQIPLRSGDNVIFATVDTAGTTKTTSDWSVISIWLYSKARNILVLMESTRDKLETHTLADWVRGVHVKFRQNWNLSIQFTGIEERTFGLGLINDLRTKHSWTVPVPIPVSTDKITNAVPYKEGVNSGYVWFPHPLMGPWVEDWDSEHSIFPRGAHDDQVDTGSMAWARSRTYTDGTEDLDTHIDSDDEEKPEEKPDLASRGFDTIKNQTRQAKSRDGMPAARKRARRGRRSWPVG